MDEFIKKHCVGLTGGIATGKSHIAKWLRGQHFSRGPDIVIDADELARKVVEPGTEGLAKIVEVFGEVLIDNQLDRKKLGSIVFSDPAQRKALEAITHPLIKKEFEKTIVDLGLDKNPRVFFYESALIHAMNEKSRFLQVWCAYCRPEVQLERLMKRNGFTKEQAQARIRSQLDAKLLADQSDVTLYTEASGFDLGLSIERAYAKLSK